MLIWIKYNSHKIYKSKKVDLERENYFLVSKVILSEMLRQDYTSVTSIPCICCYSFIHRVCPRRHFESLNLLEIERDEIFFILTVSLPDPTHI